MDRRRYCHLDLSALDEPGRDNDKLSSRFRRSLRWAASLSLNGPAARRRAGICSYGQHAVDCTACGNDNDCPSAPDCRSRDCVGGVCLEYEKCDGLCSGIGTCYECPAPTVHFEELKPGQAIEKGVSRGFVTQITFQQRSFLNWSPPATFEVEGANSSVTFTPLPSEAFERVTANFDTPVTSMVISIIAGEPGNPIGNSFAIDDLTYTGSVCP
ncbi:MAG: hypothetical protein ACI9WU_000373 [Myxococcota bacterium]|jgi:hypothetical protein